MLMGAGGGLNWRVLYFVWTMEVLNSSFCFFFFFLPPFSSEKNHHMERSLRASDKNNSYVWHSRGERDTDLAQRVPAEAERPHCPAAAVPSQRPG